MMEEVGARVAQEAWPDLTIPLAPPFPRLEPGHYEGRTVSLKTFTAFKRRNLRLDFEIFEGAAANGITLGRVPLFLALPRGRLSSASKLSRLFALMGVHPRGNRLPLEALRHRLWLVEIGYTQKDASGRPLPPVVRYSVIKAVVEHLA